MSTADIVGIVIAVIVVAAFVAAAARIMWQRRMLRERFGDEYDRAIAEKGSRAAAEAELRRRQRQHAELPLNDLSDEERTRFTERWTEVQNQFVDDPAAAVRAADRLVSKIVADRGYPVVDYSDRLTHLSVEHAHVLGNYRDAHDVSVRNDAGHATTEELRQALVHYRVLVADLLGQPDLNRVGAQDADDEKALPAGPNADADPVLVTNDPPTDDLRADGTPAEQSISNEPLLVPGATNRTEE